ncbi:MAG: flavin prenyltransferase [Desulfonauticus sp.]|nr:MAG: 3-octaprenyl-4-hydroxybenzoate carboxy-lyase [Desulfonauticus sp. 38_4375]MDK2921932.1 flavin prenyltransferase [Desulfonauticus sp.]
MLKKRIIVAITGASGVIYGIRLLEELFLRDKEIEVHAIISEVGKQVLDLEVPNWSKRLPSSLNIYGEKEFTAPMASGSWKHAGLVVVPCTMATLGAIANGVGHNLIHRAADVCLKEKRTLILVPRETPLNTIHLENMLKLKRAGAIILPPCPGFYHQPQHLEDLINQIVGRILDQLGIEHKLFLPWGETKKEV